MRAIVTGAAGFIGSTLVDTLLGEGHTVVGIDAFTDYYARTIKVGNLASANTSPAFELVEADLSVDDLTDVFDGADVVFHQAGQPGVRLSWSTHFVDYERHNITATQRLLESLRTAGVGRVVFASSSSVYGNAASYPTTEDDLPRPYSPYGVTKLAAEHLCGAYAANFGLHTTSLRYFTVYGPRQRPDMAMHRLIAATMGGPVFHRFGDGTQIRDFTYVGDVVRANLAAATADTAPGTVCNVAGTGSVSVAEVIDLVGELAGVAVPVEIHDGEAGDVSRTGGSIARATAVLGWEPATSLREGLTEQLAWQQQHVS
jgi:nucleoside-diphosphate-sugar epimerase